MVTTSSQPCAIMKVYRKRLSGSSSSYSCAYMRSEIFGKIMLAVLKQGLLLFNVPETTQIELLTGLQSVLLNSAFWNRSSVFICIGAKDDGEPFKQENLYGFMLFSLFCLACLAKMGDFGVRLSSLHIWYLFLGRSGDFSRLILTIGAAGIIGTCASGRPYILSRFNAWGHVASDFINGMIPADQNHVLAHLVEVFVVLALKWVSRSPSQPQHRPCVWVCNWRMGAHNINSACPMYHYPLAVCGKFNS